LEGRKGENKKGDMSMGGEEVIMREEESKGRK
jgi:hypothetical protein